MSKLIYLTNTSLDGYIEDAAGNFDWPTSSETYSFFTQQLSQMGTLLYGRRLYEMMAYWGSPIEAYPEEHHGFAEAWQRPNKWVYSRSLTDVSTPKTRLLGEFQADHVRALKRETTLDMTIGGAELAAQAFEAGLVDEYRVVVHPVVVGEGKPALRVSSRVSFRLMETHRFDTGAIYLRYHTVPASEG